MMRRNRRRTIIVVAIILLGISGYLYISTFGVPFKKSSVAKEIRSHLEDKYEQDVELIGAVYNFMDKRYGGVYKMNDIEFYAEKKKKQTYIDTYPYEIWIHEIEDEFYEQAMDIFPNALNVEGRYDHDEDLTVDVDDIPSYSEVDADLHLDIEIDTPFKESDEQWEAIFKMTEYVQKASKNLASHYKYSEEDDKRELMISCPAIGEQEITSIDEAKETCEQVLKKKDR